MNTSKDSIILIEDESSCGSFCSNCKELIATTKRKRMEKELRAMRNNMYIGDSDDIENNNHSSESDNDNDESDNDNDDSDTRESYSAKRSRWYLEDQERNDCLTTIWKMDEELERLITHESEDSNDSGESYSGPGAELVRFLTNSSKRLASPDCEENPASPDNSPDSPESPVCSTWCYTCDYAYESCKCLEPFSPSDNYNPCDVCGWEQCKCIKLPIKPKDNDIIILD